MTSFAEVYAPEKPSIFLYDSVVFLFVIGCEFPYPPAPPPPPLFPPWPLEAFLPDPSLAGCLNYCWCEEFRASLPLADCLETCMEYKIKIIIIT